MTYLRKQGPQELPRLQAGQTGRPRPPGDPFNVPSRLSKPALGFPRALRTARDSRSRRRAADTHLCGCREGRARRARPIITGVRFASFPRQLQDDAGTRAASPVPETVRPSSAFVCGSPRAHRSEGWATVPHRHAPTDRPAGAHLPGPRVPLTLGLRLRGGARGARPDRVASPLQPGAGSAPGPPHLGTDPLAVETRAARRPSSARGVSAPRHRPRPPRASRPGRGKTT